MESLLLFEHIPKTAGSTFNHILDRQYSRGFVIQGMDVLASIQAFEKMSPKQKQQFDHIRGHGAQLLLPHLENAFSLTFLRNPVAQLLSQYHFILNNRAHRSNEAVLRMKSVEDYFAYAKENGEDNLQTRVLAKDTSWITRDPIRESDQNMLNQALKNLAGFDRVFLTERFDEALLMLQNQLLWKKPPFYLRINQSKKRKNQPPPSRALIEKIETFQHLDMQLYAKAKELFESYRQSWPSQGELACFRAKNHWAGPLTHVAHLPKRAFRKWGRQRTVDC